MTDTNKQALEWLNWIEAKTLVRKAEREKFLTAISEIEAALQPKPSVDVEVLTDEVADVINEAHDVDMQDRDYAERVVEYLLQQGHLNQGWRDIESAPKDGSRILCACFKKKTDQAPDWTVGAIRSDYWDGTCFTQFNNHHWPPTHWMPLPQPLKSED
jgi:hypothetical protein